MQTLLQTLIVLHLTGLVMMAGTTFVDYTTFKTFWKQFDQDKGRSIALLQATSNFSRLIGIGAALLILTGIGMMAITHGAFGEQIWFRIKFGLVIILILNGLLVGRRQGLKLRKVIVENVNVIPLQIKGIKTNLNIFHLVQLCIFLMIVFLSVFKFS
ncbi:MAG: hypothetical protein JWR38_2611 [Mucilaginibacter sp.]|nr:hypothetical protein [Mucilaginibacter sp.]